MGKECGEAESGWGGGKTESLRLRNCVMKNKKYRRYNKTKLYPKAQSP